MILRRVIAHVKNQEWNAIWIDFVIVVVGVFVGIQAQQWSNDRAERKQEHEYLQRILSDINISIDTNVLNVKRLTSTSDGQAFVVDSLRRCSLPENQRDTFADGVAHIARVGPSVIVLSTMEEMLSAGKFSIIRNSKLRDTLNGLARDATYQDHVYANKVGLISAAATTTSSRVLRIYTDYKTPFDVVRWDELDLNFNALCQDREFQAAVSNLRDTANAGISLNNRALDKLHTAKAAVEAELGMKTKNGEPPQ